MDVGVEGGGGGAADGAGEEMGGGGRVEGGKVWIGQVGFLARQSQRRCECSGLCRLTQSLDILLALDLLRCLDKMGCTRGCTKQEKQEKEEKLMALLTTANESCAKGCSQADRSTTALFEANIPALPL